jgi:long-chain acyl-CoA synthetase
LTDRDHDKSWLKTYPEWLPNALPLPEESILDRFNAASHKFPDAPCIFYFDTVLRYKEVSRMACAVAGAFEQMGIRKGDRVMVWTQNIPQTAIATLAAWMRGAIVAPVNPMYTLEEIRYLIEDCTPRVLICQDDLYRPEINGDIVVMTTSPLDMLDKGSDTPDQLRNIEKQDLPGTLDFLHFCHADPEQASNASSPAHGELAYLVYTSGTTGPPKGAMISHANIVYNCLVYESAIQLNRQDKVLGVAPLFHITGIVAHLAIAFHLAIPLVLFNRFSVPDVLRLVRKYRITFTVASITVYIALLNHPETTRDDLSTLVKAYSGGAPVSPGIVDRFKEVLGLTIYNVYGLTESTSPATITPLGMCGPVDVETGALSVGLVIPGLEAWIVDVDNPEKVLPPGQAGELVLRGPGITSGYWNKPEETAHAIRNGCFFTGDVAKIDENGWCFIVDRKKDQINVSGFKVWPRDVEDVLYRHPGVKEAAVVGIPDPYQGESVKAFVALNDAYKEKTTPEELIGFCRERMAAFKYPRVVEIIDDVPKTTTGKFLRRVLKQY